MEFQQFNPPYDSPIQRDLAWVLSKYVAPEVRFVKEHEVATSISRFRIDLVLEHPGKRSVGIECDGREFHDSLADLFRDALILGSSQISTIYRFPGSLLFARPEDALYLLSIWEPELFNDRIAAQRDRLGSDEVRIAASSASWDPDYPYLFEWYRRAEGGGRVEIEATRHRFGLKYPHADSVEKIWEFSRTNAFKSVEDLADAFASQYPTGTWCGSRYYMNSKSKMFSELDAKHFN